MWVVYGRSKINDITKTNKIANLNQKTKSTAEIHHTGKSPPTSSVFRY